MSSLGSSAFGSGDPQSLAGKAPGDIVSYEEITDRDDPAFPNGARAWRVLYASTGRDNTDLTLVSGVVVAPESVTRLAVLTTGGTSTGRVVAWCHGTLGLSPRCAPSDHPADLIWGATPWGIGTVAWGSEAAGNQHVGRPEDGILAGMIDDGWIVVASDYYADRWGGDGLQPFVIGKIEAANTIDTIRAAHQLMQQVHDHYPVERYDVIPWGHSQGGHAALWTGQIFSSYLAATAAGDVPAMALAGVALEAPASNLLVQPDRQPGTGPGFGLFDWVANATLPLTGIAEPMPIGPFLFSYVFAAWARHAAAGPANPAEMPAWPDAGPLDVGALVVPEARETVQRLQSLCWSDGEEVAELVMPYREKPFLVPELSEGEVVDGQRHGAFDATSLGDPSPGVAAWCEWIRYNIPGPLGTSDLDKLPMQDGKLVPVVISAGADDGVVHCVAPAGTQGAVPTARDCMPAALYDALKAEYDRDGDAAGHLELNVWQPVAGVTAADHSDIRGLNAAASTDDPRFVGSPLHRFLTGAFEGTLAPGCSAAVANLSAQSRG